MGAAHSRLKHDAVKDGRWGVSERTWAAPSPAAPRPPPQSPPWAPLWPSGTPDPATPAMPSCLSSQLSSAPSLFRRPLQPLRLLQRASNPPLRARRAKHTFEIVDPFPIQHAPPDLGPILPAQKVRHSLVFWSSLTCQLLCLTVPLDSSVSHPYPPARLSSTRAPRRKDRSGPRLTRFLSRSAQLLLTSKSRLTELPRRAWHLTGRASRACLVLAV